MSYAPIRARAAEAPDMLSYGPAYPLYCILDFIVDSYAELTARLNTKIGDIEATLFTVNLTVKLFRTCIPSAVIYSGFATPLSQ